MSNDSNNNNNNNNTAVKLFGEDEKRLIYSRLGGTYASPVTATVKAGTTSVNLQCLPMAVLKRDNVVDDAGARVTVAQCQWSLCAMLTFGDSDVADTFAKNVRAMQSKGDAPVCVLSTDGDTVTVYYGVCTVGVNPSKGRGMFATAICAALPPAINATDVETIREGITGEASKRAGPDIAGKVNAAVNAAMTAAIAGMVAAGINPDAAPYLARGEPVPAGVPMMASAVKPTGRK